MAAHCKYSASPIVADLRLPVKQANDLFSWFEKCTSTPSYENDFYQLITQYFLLHSLLTSKCATFIEYFCNTLML